MTCIADPHKYPTKKAFREAVARDPNRVFVKDPSIFRPRSFSLGQMHAYEVITVTNHPKRSWFAEVRATPAGIKVL